MNKAAEQIKQIDSKSEAKEAAVKIANDYFPNESKADIKKIAENVHDKAEVKDVASKAIDEFLPTHA